MERLNGADQITPREAFSIRDPDTGRMIAIRDMNDEQLARFIAGVQSEIPTHHHQVRVALAAALKAEQFLAALMYESERRRLSLTIVGAFARN